MFEVLNLSRETTTFKNLDFSEMENELFSLVEKINKSDK